GSAYSSGKGANSADAVGGGARLIGVNNGGGLNGRPGGIPGAGASGGISKGNEGQSLVVAAGGGGSGAKVIATRTLTEDTPYTLVVGDSGDRGLGSGSGSVSGAHGAKGGKGRAILVAV